MAFKVLRSKCLCILSNVNHRTVLYMIERNYKYTTLSQLMTCNMWNLPQSVWKSKTRYDHQKTVYQHNLIDPKQPLLSKEIFC